MKVLMFSTDRTLLQPSGFGDALKRHQEYAKQVERLDILVLAKKKIAQNQLAPNCRAKPIYFWQAKPIINQAFKNFQYNLIICQDPFITASFGRYAKEKFGAKLIIHFHGDFFDNQYWLKEQWRNRWYKRLAQNNLKYADSLRVVSGGIKDKLINQGINAQNIFVIPTPVNLDSFAVEPLTPSDKKIVLTIGRIVKAKDFPTLIKVAQEVKSKIGNLEWQIIGQGPLLKRMKRKSKNLSFIKWLGAVDHEQLKNYYSQAALVVMTSTNESFGKVFLEAAMAKKAAVATNTVGGQEIIKDGESGYLVAIGDSDGLAERIVYLLQQPALADQMGQRAYEIVKAKFGWRKSIEAIIGMWRQTVGER